MTLVNIASFKTREIKKIVLVFFVSLVFTVTIYVSAKVVIANPTTNLVSYHDNNFSVLSLKIPQNLNFCGEAIPQNDFRIRTALEKEFFANSYWKSNSVILFNRVQKWFPYIEPILKAEGVPDDFKYMAFIESHLTNATSPAGASGFWQLVPVSARHFGLTVNDEVDERYNVERATRTACRHIKAAYAVFKNWTLCAAAYNLGISGVLYELKRQKSDSYFGLLLNAETGSFVYRILAYKTLFSNPAHFGIKKKKLSYYPKIHVKVYKTDSAIIDLRAFATSIGSSVKLIKLYNPWILTSDTIHNPEHKLYEIKLPKNLNRDYSSYLADLNINRENSKIYSAFESEAISTFSLSEITEAKQDSARLEMVRKTVFYITSANEPLKNIAHKYSVAVEDIKKWNHLGDVENIEKGKVLTIHFFESK